MARSNRKGTVYSTDGGRHCPSCGNLLAQCNCKSASAVKGDGIVRLQRQVKGRAGKPVVVITGLPLAGNDLKTMAKRLKAKCGVGGTVEDGNIIIQGDKRDQIKTELESLGHNVKLSGG
jgi:translation initiation factor 1